MSKIVFLGVEGSGKTTLTMALAKAFERHRSEGWYLKPLSRDSFRFLKMLPENLDEDAFPHQTADLRELSWQVEYKGKILTDISILDYPGEIYRLAFLDEKDERDPEAFRQKVAANKREIEALLDAVKKAERVFVLFNLNDAVDLAGNPRNLDAVWVTNACLHLLKKLDPRPDIQLLLTQADKYRAAGKDLSKFTLDEIDLVGHDHKDVSCRFISVTDAPNSEYGVECVANMLIEESGAVCNAKTKDCNYISGMPPLRHLSSTICNAKQSHSSLLKSFSILLSLLSIIGFLPLVAFEYDVMRDLDVYCVVFLICIIVSLWLTKECESVRRNALSFFCMEQWESAVEATHNVCCGINGEVAYYRAVVDLLGLAGQKVDYERSRNLFLMSQKRCKPEALIALGYMAENGLGQPPNPELAKRLYSEAEVLLNKSPEEQ